MLGLGISFLTLAKVSGFTYQIFQPKSYGTLVDADFMVMAHIKIAMVFVLGIWQDRQVPFNFDISFMLSEMRSFLVVLCPSAANRRIFRFTLWVAFWHRFGCIVIGAGDENRTRVLSLGS